MILWTIQHINAWHTLQNTGILRSDPNCIDKQHIYAYYWMCQQMQQHIGPPSCPDAFPIWAWYQWQSSRKPRPDLRVRAHLSPGEMGVRIECVVADHRVLLSDFDLWHYVLHNCYLPLSEEDDQAFEKEENRYLMQTGRADRDIPTMYQHSYPHHLREKITTSWQRIFDLEWEEDYCTHKREEKSIQATLWELSLDDVKSIQKFVAR